jgi:hypothetical protein
VGAHFHLGGLPSERVKANVDRWLTVCPENNPGLLEMFARRETGPHNLVPWAGEFVGKYLISGVQALRMSDDPRLKGTMEEVVDRLCQLQAEDGYLGPWPKKERLRGHWDLWGHYHVMLGLMMWYEQATGNPYRADAIEACCVIAWQAVMIDALKLTGDPTIADDLELTTFNAVIGSQHPSGAWCTYNTPINGIRGPSHVQINFQARSDTPHLNCCSVNGPRGYGTISEWGLMRSDDALVLNYYGPMRAELKLADGTPVVLREETDYPIGGAIKVKLELPAAKQLTLMLRIPLWSAKTEVSVAGRPAAGVEPGRYLKLARQWQNGDEVTLRLDMGLRYEAGDLEQAAHASIYRGPILLCSDSRFNKPLAPPIDVARLGEAKLVPLDNEIEKAAGEYQPWIVVDLPAMEGRTARLIDFASAGATTIEGKALSEYVSWLPATGLRPPRPVAWLPADGSKVGPGPIRFTWRVPAPHPHEQRQYEVLIAESPEMRPVVVRFAGIGDTAIVVPADQTRVLRRGTQYYWKLLASNKYGTAESVAPYKQFTIDPTAPVLSDLAGGARPSDQMLTEAPLRGDVKPVYGSLLAAKGWQVTSGPDQAAKGAIELDGRTGIVRYAIPRFPEEDYSVSVWVSIRELPGNRYGQVFSAWARPMDDPLRLTVQSGKLYARIEAGSSFQTPGVAVETGKWYHVAAVKQGGELKLYLDGRARGTTLNVATLFS